MICFFFSGCSSKEKTPPNFVFIVVDDLGWADVKCNYPGRATDHPAVSMDYFTTVLNLAGIEHQPHDGVNLVPLLTGEKTTGRETLFWHFPHYHGSAWKPGSALRQGDWKLVVHYESNLKVFFYQ